MATVFVLSGVWEYEGGEVLGVFVDRPSAEMASARWLGDYDSFEIAEWQVESGPPPVSLLASVPFGWAKAG